MVKIRPVGKEFAVTRTGRVPPDMGKVFDKAALEQAVAYRKKVPVFSQFDKPQPSAWDFWNYGCSVSFLQTWLQCRETARLKYVEGWRCRDASDPMEYGNIGHAVLDKAYDSVRIPKPAEIDSILTVYHKQWLERNPQVASNSHAITNQLRLYRLHKSVLPHYFKRWDGDFTGKYTTSNDTVQPAKWVEKEAWFEVPWKFPDGRCTKLIGRFDGYFLDRKENEWLFETKFKGMVNEDNITELVQCDLQVMLYLWVAYAMGRKPKGVLYNVVRRPGNRQGKFESDKDFFARVAAEVAKPKSYDHYFMRWESPFLKKEVDAFAQRILAPLLNDVRAWWEGRLPSYPNPCNYETKYGMSDYFRPIAFGDFSRHVRNKHAAALFEPRS